jgi:hypothetical protein
MICTHNALSVVGLLLLVSDAMGVIESDNDIAGGWFRSFRTER